MTLIDLIPYLQNVDKLKDLELSLGLNIDSDEILIYALGRLDIRSDLLLIEIEKTGDELSIEINNNNFIQIMPISLAQELVINDFSDIKTNEKIAKRLIDYRVNDA